MSVRYTHAVLCRVPQSLRTRGEVKLDDARKQHQALAQQLRELGIDVVEMPPDESSPLCAYVEDTAVVCNGIALIARPTDSSRNREVSCFIIVRQSSFIKQSINKRYIYTHRFIIGSVTRVTYSLRDLIRVSLNMRYIYAVVTPIFQLPYEVIKALHCTHYLTLGELFDCFYSCLLFISTSFLMIQH